MKLQAALDRFLLQLQADGRSPHTVGQCRRHTQVLIGWLSGHDHTGELKDITDEDLALFLCSDHARNRPDGKPKCAGTMNAMRSSLRTLFRFLHEADLIQANPARMVRMALTSPPPPRALRDHEAAKLRAVLESAEEPEARRDLVLLEFLIGTGARLSSALALRVEDLDLDDGIAHLHTMKRGRQQVLYLSDKLRNMLRRHLNGRRDGAVFCSGSGEHLSSRHAQRRLRQWREFAGISRQVTAHSCRHRFAMKLYAKTRDILVVQAALGHGSVSSSLVYARVDENRVREEVAGISSVA